jgi:hypothetical protein
MSLGRLLWSEPEESDAEARCSEGLWAWWTLWMATRTSETR